MQGGPSGEKRIISATKSAQVSNTSIIRPKPAWHAMLTIVLSVITTGKLNNLNVSTAIKDSL